MEERKEGRKGRREGGREGKRGEGGRGRRGHFFYQKKFDYRKFPKEFLLACGHNLSLVFYHLIL